MTTDAPAPPIADPARRETHVIRVVSSRVPLSQRLADIWRYRELLAGLTRKELKVKYKNSILGFLWSLLNPATVLLVYYVVFQIILKNGIPGFAIYLISGILVWNLFSTGLPGACVSVTGNASIVKKVSFPREILAFASVGASLIHFFLQSVVLIMFLLAFRHGPAIGFLPLLVPALLCLVILTAALGVFLAAVNVRLRDTQHLLDIGLQVWFWATPIVYQYRLVRDNVAKSGHSIYHAIWYLYRFNPVTPIVLAFQRSLYGKTSPRGGHGTIVHILPDHAGLWWYTWQLLLVLAFSMVLLGVALKVFGRLEGNFAEEL